MSTMSVRVRSKLAQRKCITADKIPFYVRGVLARESG